MPKGTTPETNPGDTTPETEVSIKVLLSQTQTTIDIMGYTEKGHIPNSSAEQSTKHEIIDPTSDENEITMSIFTRVQELFTEADDTFHIKLKLPNLEKMYPGTIADFIRICVETAMRDARTRTNVQAAVKNARRLNEIQ